MIFLAQSWSNLIVTMRRWLDWKVKKRIERRHFHLNEILGREEIQDRLEIQFWTREEEWLQYTDSETNVSNQSVYQEKGGSKLRRGRNPWWGSLSQVFCPLSLSLPYSPSFQKFWYFHSSRKEREREWTDQYGHMCLEQTHSGWKWVKFAAHSSCSLSISFSPFSFFSTALFCTKFVAGIQKEREGEWMIWRRERMWGERVRENQ